jgi:hypothetical protein
VPPLAKRVSSSSLRIVATLLSRTQRSDVQLLIVKRAQVVIFFKMGKFYELFEEDALVCLLPSP